MKNTLEIKKMDVLFLPEIHLEFHVYVLIVAKLYV